MTSLKQCGRHITKIMRLARRPSCPMNMNISRTCKTMIYVFERISTYFRTSLQNKPLLQVHLGSYERAPHLDEVPGKTRINLIETPYNLIDKDIVCYPNLVLYFKCRVFRLFMKPRIVYSAITVDLVKGNAARANMFPNYVTIEISESAPIPQLIDNTAAVDAAAAVTLKWLRHRYKVYKAPDITIMKQKEVYKAFFYIQDERNQDVLVDS